MDKNTFNKIKGNMPEIKSFARRHISELFTTAALILGALSAWRGMFFGGVGITLFFLVVGTLVGIFLQKRVDEVMKTLYQFIQKRGKTSEIVIGICMVVVAILIPFLYFGKIGLLAGCSYHYFTRHAQQFYSKDKAA